MKVIRSTLLIAAMMIVAVGHLHAQALDLTPDLTTATLEELMNIEVTSVSKGESAWNCDNSKDGISSD